MKDFFFDWTDCVNGIKNGNNRAFEFLYEKTYYDLKIAAPAGVSVLVKL